MCTSFGLYADQTYIGMNFDISDRPIKLCLKGENQFLIYQKDGGKFLPAFGINKNGTFMNLLMVKANAAGEYRRGKDCLHIIKLFDNVLGEKISLDELDTVLQEKTIVNVPNISVHSMIAAKNGRAYVIEPGRTNLSFNPSDQNFLALTNFPLTNLGEMADGVTGAGADRYQVCTQLLAEHQGDFDVAHGLSILASTAQAAGDYPTQLSMLAMPEEGIIYFTVKRNYQKRFTFSFADELLRTDEGFAAPRAITLDKRGVLLSALEEW